MQKGKPQQRELTNNHLPFRLYDVDNVKDNHVKTLAKRCDKLSLLILRQTPITTLTPSLKI